MTPVLLSWVPFRTPAPLWDVWWLLLIPLVAGLAVAYKATKSPTPARLAWESLKLIAYVLAFLVVGALVLRVVVNFVTGN